MATVSDPTSRLLAHRIRVARLGRGWTLAELSTRMTVVAEALGGPGLSGALLGRIENCTRPVSVPELDAIAASFSITASHLTRPGEVCTTCGQEIPS